MKKKDVRDKVIYISGKYTGHTPEETNANIQKARLMAAKVWELGYTCLCPHTNTMNFEEICKCSYDDYLNGDLTLLNLCNGILLLDNYEDSNGAKIELDFARQREMRVFYSFDELKQAKWS
jgi:hypothetical protein